MSVAPTAPATPTTSAAPAAADIPTSAVMSTAAATAVGYTAAQLAARGPEDIPPEFVTSTHLVYSSPAALAFNSPGAEGYGVKRAGLAVPGSVMLIVSPGCCGRNTSSISSLPGYEGRFFYLTMSQTDLVTGSHLKRIPKAVRAIVDGLDHRPSVVMVCATCVDALLGTDMDRVCQKAQEAAGVPVRPCYMYALTREGHKPPMVGVRQTIYGLVEPAKRRDPLSCNLMGFFSPIDQRSDLRALLHQAGIRHVREVSSCANWDEFQQMGQANFNLVLNLDARPAAQDLERRLGMPSIELTRFYEVDRIHSQYEALTRVLGVSLDHEDIRMQARDAMRAFRGEHADEVFAVGECCNANPFELALALLRYGFGVAEIFGTVTTDSYFYLRRIAQLSPDTMVYSNLEPSMAHYDPQGSGVTVAIGRDAGYYHPEAARLDWSSDVQPFGYQAVVDLFGSLGRLLDGGQEGHGQQLDGSISLAAEHAAAMRDGIPVGSLVELPKDHMDDVGKKDDAAERIDAVDKGGAGENRKSLETGAAVEAEPPQANKHQDSQAVSSRPIRGFRRVLTPFAPDQSGAVAALYGLGGAVVVVDAGGCVGNICGFDEPRWFQPNQHEAIFSAALRDMDAILGRDDALVAKVQQVLEGPCAGVRFVALVGTPVPAVIGTDLRALAHMIQRRCGVPALAVECNGMRGYDDGAAKAYRAYLERFCPADGVMGVLGATPLDVPEGVGLVDGDRVAEQPGRNLAVSPAGVEAARYIQSKLGTPFDVDAPWAAFMLPQVSWDGRRVLVVNQQVLADSVRWAVLACGAKTATCATFFLQTPEATREGDVRLRDEGDFARAVRQTGADTVLADPVLRELIPDFEGKFYALPHFALSGKLAPMQAARSGATA